MYEKKLLSTWNEPDFFQVVFEAVHISPVASTFAWAGDAFLNELLPCEITSTNATRYGYVMGLAQITTSTF